MMSSDRYSQRAMLWTVVLASILVTTGLAGGGPKAALGMAVGAALGIISLWTLAYAIPRFVHPERPDRRMILGLVYLFKLFVFGGILWIAMRSPHVDPFGVFIGALIVPTLIVGLRLKDAIAISTESMKDRFGSPRRPPRTPT